MLFVQFIVFPVHMADNLPSNSGFSARHRNSRLDESPSTSGVCNDDKAKLNPWKPISAPENNALEADAWPEPSAGETRRIVNSKTSEDKPKTGKIKWQNFDDDGNSYGFSRGRGRYSGVSFNPSYGPAGTVNQFRRGSGGYRPRGVDYYRGRGSFYNRHANKVFPFRFGGELRYDRSTTSESKVNNSSEGNNVAEDMARLSIESPEGITEDVACSSTNTSTNEVDTLQNNMSTAITNKRVYRDRNISTAQNTLGNNTFAYDSGPVGRARRSYLRQQPSFQSDQDIALQPLISMPLMPFQAIPPLTYFIPGVGGTVLGPAGMPVAPGLSGIAVTSETSGAYSSEPTLAPLPTSNNAVSTTKIISDQMGTTAHLPVPKQSTMVNTEATGEVLFLGVDVVEMVADINSIGWDNVIFPSSLQQHPPVAAAIRSLVTDVGSSDVLSQSNNESPSAISNDETDAKPVGKREDVVIVENKIFFVPRNVNRTKFLKFFSKSNYIRHHIEYYFSDANLQRDVHLLTILSKHRYVCPISDLLLFNRLRWVSTTEAELLDAVAKSSNLTVKYSTDGSPFAIARNFTTDAGLSLLIPSTSTVSDVSSNVEVGSSSDKPMDVVASPVASSPSTIVQQIPQSPSIPPNSSTTAVAILSSGQQPFVQPHPYLSIPRAETSDASTLLNLPYAASHFAGSVPGICTLPAQYYANQLDVSAVPQQNVCSAATPQQMGISQTAHLFSGNRHPATNAYTGGGQPTYLAVTSNPAALQAAADPNAASLMTALYRVGATGVPGNMGGAYIPSLGNTGNAIAPGYAAQQNNGSTVLLQFLPGAAHPGPGGYYSNGSQPAGVPGSAFLGRTIQNAVSPPNVWIPVGAAVPQNVVGTSSHGASNNLQSIVAFPPNAFGAAGMPLTTTTATSTSSVTGLYPTMIPQVPIPVNAFALVPNPTMEANVNANVIGGGGSGPGTLLGGASEAASAGHQRPVHSNNSAYMLNNHHSVSSVASVAAATTTGSARFSGHAHSLSEGGVGHVNSKKPSVSGNETAGDGSAGHS